MPTGKVSDSPRRIFLCGMFDMKNFGDLLFPQIARERLAPYGIEVVPVSPTGAGTGFADAMPSVALTEMLHGEIAVDGIGVGGGYMIHSHKMHFLDEYAADGIADYAGPGLWLGATLAAAARDVPVVWNAPGVPHPFPQSQRALIDQALRASDYLSLRDRGSAELLSAPADALPQIVPDPIADIARLWRTKELGEVMSTFAVRKGFRPDARYAVFHFRNRSLNDIGVDGVAHMLRNFCGAYDVVPILVAVGQTHADDALARDISRHLDTPHVVVDDPYSLCEIAAVIAHASVYVGASLHGYVAAAAYGVPGVLVAQPSYRKFQGFLDHTGRDDLAHDWREAFEIAARRLREPHESRIPDSVFAALDSHWARIADAITSPERRRRPRLAFLRTWLRAGAEAAGPAWPHLPYARRTVRNSQTQHE